MSALKPKDRGHYEHNDIRQLGWSEEHDKRGIRASVQEQLQTGSGGDFQKGRKQGELREVQKDPGQVRKVRNLTM